MTSTELLAFYIDQELYGIDISLVNEIMSYFAPSLIRGTNPYVLGVVNIRDQIIPLVDLRIKLNRPADNPPGITIIAQFRNKPVGLAVDAVAEVLHINETQLKEIPRNLLKDESNFLENIGLLEGDKLISIINMDALLKADIPSLENI